MATTARIMQYARWLEEMAPEFMAMVILTETGNPIEYLSKSDKIYL
jgi:hypothetical protein